MVSLKQVAWNNYQFRGLRIYMRMVERMLVFVHASRNYNWKLHLSAGEDLIKDFVANDRLNYHRLMPDYLADMKALENKESAIWDHSIKGNFCK